MGLTRRIQRKQPRMRGYVRCQSVVPELAGRSFQSQLERDRAQDLVMLQKAGEIEDLRFQVRVVACATPKGDIMYYADYAYTDCRTGQEWIEDAKGMVSDRFRIIRKLWSRFGHCPLRITKRVPRGTKIVTTEEIWPTEGMAYGGYGVSTESDRREWGCLSCAHMFLCTGWPGTDVTPGDESTSGCRKGHWEFGWHDKRETFVDTMKLAAKCKDYEHDL